MTMTQTSFPRSLPEFQRMFPDDAACAAYLEAMRWRDGFRCPRCGSDSPPYRFTARPGVLRCRDCRRNIALTADTVMERTHTPLSTWFWAAYLVTSLTPGMSARQFQRQLGLTRYETAFQMLHKLRAGMVAPQRERIGAGALCVEVDETWIGGRTRGLGKGVHEQIPVIGAVEVRERLDQSTKSKRRRGGRIAGRLRLAVVPDRSAESLCGFIEAAVDPAGADLVVTDAWSGYAGLAAKGYQHLPVAERDDPQVSEDYLPIVHLIFSNLKSWLTGVHHGVSDQHLQAYLNEFTFRFNRRFWPMNSFRSLLGLSAGSESPTYGKLYSGEWQHPSFIPLAEAA